MQLMQLQLQLYYDCRNLKNLEVVAEIVVTNYSLEPWLEAKSEGWHRDEWNDLYNWINYGEK